MTNLTCGPSACLVVATPAVPKTYPVRDLFRLPYAVKSIVDSRDHEISDILRNERETMDANLTKEADLWAQSHGERWQACWMAMHEHVSFQENRKALLDLKVMSFEQFTEHQKDFVLRSPVNILTPATEREFASLAVKGQACIADFESLLSTGRIAGSITEQLIKVRFDELPYQLRSELALHQEEALYFKRYTDVSKLDTYITRSEVLDYLTYFLESRLEKTERLDSILLPKSNTIAMEI